MKVLQGGIYNFLGKQKTVNAPIRWKSSPKHPIAYLTYITKKEMDILIKKNIYGSLKGKPNKGPFGLPSLQGSGSGAGGDSGGDSGGVSSADSAAGAGFGTSATGEGGGEADAAASGAGQAGEASYSDYSDATMGPVGPAAMGINTPSEETETQETQQLGTGQQMARTSPIGIAAFNMSLANPTRSTAEKAIGFALSPIGSIMATMADTSMRGVTAPNDYSQATQSVQTTPTSDSGNGIGSFDSTYKPFNNTNLNTPYTRKPFFVLDPLTGALKSLL